MAKEAKIEAQGVVLSAEPEARFVIRLDTGMEVNIPLSGQMSLNRIRVVPGDRVLAELSPYDLTRGRIIRRLQQEDNRRES